MIIADAAASHALNVSPPECEISTGFIRTIAKFIVLAGAIVTARDWLPHARCLADQKKHSARLVGRKARLQQTRRCLRS
jgi:hypothetical protein